jgi:hypothetical protein
MEKKSSNCGEKVDPKKLNIQNLIFNDSCQFLIAFRDIGVSKPHFKKYKGEAVSN